MAKTPNAAAIDQIQDSLRESLAAVGFRKRGRNFSRTSSDGLTEIINFQMGTGGLPGGYDILGLRESHEGRFTVNLGVYVPEVDEKYGCRKAGASIREYDCCVRERLGVVGPERADLWWPAQDRLQVVEDIRGRLFRDALPYLERYSTRDRILEAYAERPDRFGTGSPPARIVVAIILLEKGDIATAKQLLSEQANSARDRNLGHARFVEEFAERLGLGPLS